MEKDENLKLLKELSLGNESAREQLILANTPLVWSIVRRFLHRGYDPEDLFQIGSIGLMKAIDRFDLDYEVRFSTYAVTVITGEIRRFLRDDGMIKVSRGLKEMAFKASRAREHLGVRLGREPTLGELAGALGVAAEEVAAAMESSAEVESLHKPISQGDGKEIRLMDHIEDPSQEQEQLLDRMVLEELMQTLSQEERALILGRYYQGKTQMQMAGVLGVSQVQVSRLERKILRKLREGWEGK